MADMVTDRYHFLAMEMETTKGRPNRPELDILRIKPAHLNRVAKVDSSAPILTLIHNIFWKGEIMDKKAIRRFDPDNFNQEARAILFDPEEPRGSSCALFHDHGPEECYAMYRCRKLTKEADELFDRGLDNVTATQQLVISTKGLATRFHNQGAQGMDFFKGVLEADRKWMVKIEAGIKKSKETEFRSMKEQHAYIAEWAEAADLLHADLLALKDEMKEWKVPKVQASKAKVPSKK